jgi:hypothetical protein
MYTYLMASPATAVAPDLIRRITYSKYLLRRATFLQREGNELATAEALLFAHDGAVVALFWAEFSRGLAVAKAKSA